jgi:DNA invertase Pin-like site-specific DNA recombinase
MNSEVLTLCAPAHPTPPRPAPRLRKSQISTLFDTKGIYKGRKPSIDAAELRRLRDEEKLGPAAIARRLGIGRASVYRVLGKPAAPAYPTTHAAGLLCGWCH